MWHKVLYVMILIMNLNICVAIEFRSGLLNSNMEQHGAFLAEDLRTSPLLKDMFNLSVNEVNKDLVRVCILPANNCRVMRRDARVYLVAARGKVRFEDALAK